MIPWREANAENETEAAFSALSPEQREEAKRAASKALQLLLARQRTEKELQQKLIEKAFSPEAVEAAMAYARSYGYLDDLHYAEVYLHSMQEKKSRSLIRRELLQKGVSTEQIDEVFATQEGNEEETAYRLLCKKAGDPHPLEEKEVARLAAYLGRRGFSSSVIWSQIRRYRNDEA